MEDDDDFREDHHDSYENDASRKKTGKTSKPVAKKSTHKKAAETSGSEQPEKSRPKKKQAKRAKKAAPLPVAAPFMDDDDDDLTLPSYGRTMPGTIVGDFEDDEDEDEFVPKPSSGKKRSSGKSRKKAVKSELKSEPEREKKSSKRKKEKPLFDPDTGLPIFERPQQGKQKPPRNVWDPEIREYVPLEKARSELIPPEFLELVQRKKKAKSTEKPKSMEKAQKPEIPVEVAEKPQKKKKSSKPKKAVREPESSTRKTEPPRGIVGAPTGSDFSDALDVEVPVKKKFGNLKLSSLMLDAVSIARYLEPTPIQAGVIPRVLAGVDVMGQARTGTGKTAAYLIPVIERIEECEPGDNPVGLILVPTRELAVQVRDEAVKLSYGRDIRTVACYGGKPIAKQLARLKQGADMVVGTPGRILDLMKRGALNWDDLHWIVLDEADRMLDIGFRPDIEKILRKTPKERQTLLFSATLDQSVVRLAERYMKEPEILDFSDKGIDVDTIEQFYVTVDPERKFDALVHLLNKEEPQQAIIFCRTKRGADRLARLLESHVKNMATIHGDLQQSVRDSVMSRFRSGKLRYLVATDIVGRGIDISGISHIINYDIPAFCDDYVHRVGRTGRMGREGVAYTFVTIQEGAELTRIEMRINKLLKRAELKNFEAFSRPTDVVTQEEKPDAKPVFGKPVRKIRKAL